MRVRFPAWLLLFLFPASVSAQEDRDGYQYELFGEWRYVFSHAQDFPLNVAGDVSGLTYFVDQRLDVGTVQQVNDSLEFTGELEIFYGQVAGDADHVGAEFRGDARETLRGWDLKMAELRQLWLSWRTSWFLLRAGQMGSNWGVGLLANDGRPQPGRFGFPDKGDLSDRIILATRPLASFGGWLSKIVMALGAGVVYRDENASLRDGDVGAEMIASVFYRDGGIDAGLYVAGRLQEDADETSINAVAIDFYGGVDAGVGHTGLVAAIELAFLAGSTDRVIHADRTDGLDLLSFGAVVRAGWRFDWWESLPQLELGYASGDANPHDDTITVFSFDPDYKVGLVLFDTVMRGITAMSAQESADPERVGEPLRGTDLLPSEGRVSGAIYLYPNVQMKPLEQLTLMAGFLYAWSAVPFAQSYQTFKNGGVATNPYGLTGAGRDLGFELDLGFDWDQPIWGKLHLVAGVQAGWFFPGKAFDRPDGSRPGIVSRILGRAALAW